MGRVMQIIKTYIFKMAEFQVVLFTCMNGNMSYTGRKVIHTILTLMMFFCSESVVSAQEIIITGRVSDVLTNEPIPFANIAFKGTTIGINTDMDGRYTLKTTTPGDSLTASFVGYTSVTQKISKSGSQVVNFVLKVNRVELKEVIIVAGENPAHVLLKKIIDHKEQNDKERLESYTYETYNKLEFDITEMPDNFKKNKLLKPFAFIFDKVDSSISNERPSLPFFMTESVSDYYYRKNPKAKREKIRASKVSGMENTTITEFLGDMYQNIDVYDNYIDVFGKSFISPVSNIGLAFYKYYLTDSTFIDGLWCYKLKFKPRRKQELTFTGDCWVHDTTFAIKKINMRIADDANINFVNDLAVIKEYKQVDNQHWMIIKDLLVIDFKAREKGVGLIGRRTASYKDFKINQPIDNAVFRGSEETIIADDAALKDENYWVYARHDSLTKREKDIYALVDTIKSIPAFRTYLDIITLFVTGYKQFRNFPVEFGPYYTLVSFNTVEGYRLRLGGRTTDNFSTRFEINGYAAYGTKDMRFKYKGGFKYFISKKPRQIFNISYKDDVMQLANSDNSFQDDNILTSLFRRSPSSKLNNVLEKKVSYEIEWIPGFSNRITVNHNDFTPLGDLSNDSVFYFYNESYGLEPQKRITTAEISLFTRFLYREKFVNGKTGRISLGSKYPLLQVNYTLGVKGIFHSDFYYHKVSARLSDSYKINPVGYMYYSLEAGKVFGAVPYPLLTLHPGNESYFYDQLSFNLMNYFEFASDQYVSLLLSHHFDGFFLNKIPLMRKLKWREVASAHAVIGSLSDENRGIFAKVSGKKEDQKYFYSFEYPYVELGAGIENIFKLFRFDVVWRLSYMDHPNAVPFGFRGSLQLMF